MRESLLPPQSPQEKLRQSRETFIARENVRGRLQEKQQQIAQHLEELGVGPKVDHLRNAVNNLGKGQASQQEGFHSAFLHIAKEALQDMQGKGTPTQSVEKEIAELESLYQEYWGGLQQRRDNRNAEHADHRAQADKETSFDAMSAEDIARQLEALHAALDKENPPSEEAA